MRKRTGAFTLLEVTIAMMLMGVLMAMVFDAMSSVRRSLMLTGDNNDLAVEARRVANEVMNDLGNSAWYLCTPSDAVGRDAYLANLQDPAADRALRYYPYVQVQFTGTGAGTQGSGLGSAFPNHNRTGASVLDVRGLDPATLPASLPAAHRQWSQEVIFLKVRRSAQAAHPSGLNNERVSFGDVAGSPNAWQAKVNGTAPVLFAVPGDPTSTISLANNIVSDSLNLTSVANQVTDSPMVLEEAVWPVDQTDATSIANCLREYSYIVVPNQRTGKGRLLRVYRNGNGGVVDATRALWPGSRLMLDKVISENVDCMQVDTYRTLSSLNVNQVRLTLYLSRRSGDRATETWATYRVEVTGALRSTVDPEYSLNLGTWLGSAGASDLRTP